MVTPSREFEASNSCLPIMRLTSPTLAVESATWTILLRRSLSEHNSTHCQMIAGISSTLSELLSQRKCSWVPEIAVFFLYGGDLKTSIGANNPNDDGPRGNVLGHLLT